MISLRIAARTVAWLLFLGALYRQGCQFLSLDIVHSVGINRILVVSWVILHGIYIYTLRLHVDNTGCNTYQDNCLYNVCSRSTRHHPLFGI